MAQQPKTIRKDYPLPVYNFRVTVLLTPLKLPGVVPGSEVGAQAVRFSEVSGLNLHFAPVVYRDGFSFIAGPTILPGMTREFNLTLKRGILHKGDELYNWLLETRQPLTRGKRDLLIDLCDENGVASVRWIVEGAMPVQLSAPDFIAQSGDVAIETLELIAAGMSMQFID